MSYVGFLTNPKVSVSLNFLSAEFPDCQEGMIQGGGNSSKKEVGNSRPLFVKGVSFFACRPALRLTPEVSLSPARSTRPAARQAQGASLVFVWG